MRLASIRFALHGLVARLARDTAGNTLMIVAAALLPLAAMIGSGVDIGRAYLSETRLQQACDAGVLAARKRLGTEAAVSGTIPDDAQLAGERFFNVNFGPGDYGTRQRTFVLSLEDDYAITGKASVEVPTTLMAIFGFADMPVKVQCQAQLNMANTDVMMVLDVTGSMAETNPGDSMSKIDALKATVRSFYAQLSAAAPSNSTVQLASTQAVAPVTSAAASPSPSASSSPSVAASTVAPSASSATTPQCLSTDLNATSVAKAGSSGTSATLVVALKNTSGHPCITEGYPGLEFAPANGTPLQPVIETRVSAGLKRQLTVAANATVSTLVTYQTTASGATPGADCYTPSVYVLIIPPNQQDQLMATITGGPITVCANGAVSLTPLVPGSSG